MCSTGTGTDEDHESQIFGSASAKTRTLSRHRQSFLPLHWTIHRRPDFLISIHTDQQHSTTGRPRSTTMSLAFRRCISRHTNENCELGGARVAGRWGTF